MPMNYDLDTNGIQLDAWGAFMADQALPNMRILARGYSNSKPSIPKAVVAEDGDEDAIPADEAEIPMPGVPSRLLAKVIESRDSTVVAVKRRAYTLRKPANAEGFEKKGAKMVFTMDTITKQEAVDRGLNPKMLTGPRVRKVLCGMKGRYNDWVLLKEVHEALIARGVNCSSAFVNTWLRQLVELGVMTRNHNKPGFPMLYKMTMTSDEVLKKFG
jgi:hypothetical protein